MVSIGKSKANLLNSFSNESKDKSAKAQANRSSEPDGIMHLTDLSDKLVDPYLLRRYGKYLICLARENLKDDSVTL